MVQGLWYQSLTHGILRLIWKVLWMEKHLLGFTELRTLCGGTSEYKNMGSGEGPSTRYFNKFLGIFRYSNVNPESLGWRVYGGLLVLTGISLDSRWEYCVNHDCSKELRMGRSTVQTPRVNPNPPNVGATESCTNVEPGCSQVMTPEALSKTSQAQRHVACTQISRGIQIDADTLGHSTSSKDLLVLTCTNPSTHNSKP